MGGLFHPFAPELFEFSCLACLSSPSACLRCPCLSSWQVQAALNLQSLRSMYGTSDEFPLYLPKPLRIDAPMQQPFLPKAIMYRPYQFQRDSYSSPPSMADGIEVVKGSTPTISSGEVEMLNRRYEGMRRTKDIIYEQIANNQFPMEESESIVRCLEIRSDVCVRQTYSDGKRVSELSETALIPRVGLTFMPGADTPQVNRMEQIGMACTTPDQKSASWRVNTAGTLLNDFEVDTDLSIIQSDNTAHVIARSQKRNLLSDTHPKMALSSRRADERTVTIHSDHVKIVNNLSAGTWDLECTLIEVDGSSLVNLIVNYRHLIYRGGPALNFAETVFENYSCPTCRLTYSDQTAGRYD